MILQFYILDILIISLFLQVYAKVSPLSHKKRLWIVDILNLLLLIFDKISLGL